MANEKRVRANNVYGTISDVSGIDNSVTTFNSTGLAALSVVDATNHAAITLEPATANMEIVYVTAHTAAATSVTITRGQEGTLAVSHANGATWIHGPTVRDFAIGRMAYAKRVAGNLTPAGTTWAALANAPDLTVKAQVGDIIEFGMCGRVDPGSYSMFFDAYTMVGGSPVTCFGVSTIGGGSNYGIAGLIASGSVSVGGSAFLIVGSGDISAGTVTVRMYARSDGGSKYLNAGANAPLFCYLKNLGPQES